MHNLSQFGLLGKRLSRERKQLQGWIKCAIFCVSNQHREYAFWWKWYEAKIYWPSIHIKWNAALQKQALLDEQTNVFTLKCFIKKKTYLKSYSGDPINGKISVRSHGNGYEPH